MFAIIVSFDGDTVPFVATVQRRSQFVPCALVHVCDVLAESILTVKEMVEVSAGIVAFAITMLTFTYTPPRLRVTGKRVRFVAAIVPLATFFKETGTQGVTLGFLFTAALIHEILI